jgi:hypothetical protein
MKNNWFKKSINNLILIFIIVILLVGGYRYYQYMIKKNFILEMNTICDVKTEKCFSPSPDLGFLDTPYKKVSIIANLAPRCLEEHNCESFSCSNISDDPNICAITYCSDDTKDSGEECLTE